MSMNGRILLWKVKCAMRNGYSCAVHLYSVMSAVTRDNGFPEGECEADYGPMKLQVFIEDGMCKPPARNCFLGSVVTDLPADKHMETIHSLPGLKTGMDVTENSTFRNPGQMDCV